MKEKVKDIMSKKVISVTPSDSIRCAAKLMQENNIGSVPVVSGGQVKGMLTDRDIILRCVAFGKNPEQVKAEDIMTSHVAYVSSNQSAEDAVNLMAAEQVRRLPVVDDGAIQGMVSFCDVARAHEPDVGQAIEEISEVSKNQIWNDHHCQR